MSGSTSVNASSAPGQFRTDNGRIIGPNGAAFTARGINVFASQMGDANQILKDFPGLNFVRLAVYNYDSPDAYATFINTMSSRGVVVELEDHTSSDGSNQGGGRGSAFTGPQLTNELNWYSSVARAYASNPFVWFGTDNEPPNAGLSTWEQQTYNAIRSTGNNNPIMLELPGGAYPGAQSIASYGMDPSVYAAMSNIVADVHSYGWSSSFIPDQQTVGAALTDLVQGARTMPSASGNVPVILGEYGPSSETGTPDANADQVLLVAQQSNQTAGAVAFAWSGRGANSLTDEQANPTPYGQQVAQWIASSSQASAAGAASPTSATVGQGDISTFAASGTNMSLISGSNDTEALAAGTNGGGNVYVLPAAGNGPVASTSDILNTANTPDLTTALAATDSNGAASTLPNYPTVTDSSEGAAALITATLGRSGTAIGTNAGASDLNFGTLLAHSIT